MDKPSARPFDGLDKLPFDRLRVFDTASKLMPPGGVDRLKFPAASVRSRSQVLSRSRLLCNVMCYDG